MLNKSVIKATRGSVALGEGAKNNTIIINDIETIKQAILGDIPQIQKLSVSLSVTQTALESFFKIIEHEKVPESQLASTLTTIAMQYLEAIKAVESLIDENPNHKDTLNKAKQALKDGNFQEQRDLLKVVAEAESAAADKAEELEEKARQNKEKRLLKSSIAHCEIGVSYAVELDYPSALNSYKKAFDLLLPIQFCTKEVQLKLLEYIIKIGETCFTLAHFDEALAYYEKAVDNHSQSIGEDHFFFAIIMNNMGLVFKEKSNFEKAIRYLKIARNGFIKIYHKDHFEVGVVLSNLGSIYLFLDDLDKAAFYTEKALYIGYKEFKEEHPCVGGRRSTIGIIWTEKARKYSTQGRYGRAKQAFKRAKTYLDSSLENLTNIYGELHPEITKVRRAIGMYWLYRKKPDKAIVHLKQALTDNLAIFNHWHPITARCHAALGSYWFYVKNYDYAITHLNHAVDIFRHNHNELHPEIAPSKALLEEAKIRKLKNS